MKRKVKKEKPQEDPKPKALKKFDYKVVLVPVSMERGAKEKVLDGFGVEGWELVGFLGENAVFKRLIA